MIKDILPRDRVIKALKHQVTDRVPLDFWSTPEVMNNLKKHFNTDSEELVLRQLHIDIRQFQPEEKD